MSLLHRPYPKISTTTDSGGGGREWVATEKIHGAQLVVATDGHETRVGKRKDWLTDAEPFFGWQLLRVSSLQPDEEHSLHELVRAAITARIPR